DTYYLYYVGSDNYISQLNNIGPGNRFVGVATSADGVNWTKHASNPILTWSVAGNPEEGVPAAGFFFDTNGDFLTYYSASHAATATTPQVWSDIRVARSTDGYNFTDEGLIAAYNNPAIWGYGDELHPVAGYTNGSNYYAFYIPNGTLQTSRLGALWGSTADNRNHDGPVINSAPVPLVRGPASIVPLDSDTLAFFNSYQGDIYVRTASAADPVHTMSAPVAVYGTDPGHNGVIIADTAANTWFMYYNGWSYMGMMTAPMGDADATGPLAPDSGGAAAADYKTVNLQWAAGNDPETGVLEYNVYRDGAPIGVTRERTFQDRGAAELTEYSYEVRPVNLHGTEGAAVALNVATPADLTPPGVRSAAGSGDATLLSVVFDEAVDPATAGDPSRYALSDGVDVLGASLGPDGRTVTLTTSPQAPQTLYSLTVDGVRDAAAAANAGSPQSRYTFSQIGSLVAYYRFDAGLPLTEDTSGLANHGQAKGGVTASGGVGHFDGSGYVEIDDNELLDETFAGSVTVAAWARPQDVPPYTDASDRAYAVFTSPNMSIEYDKDRRFFARLATSGGSVSILSTSTFDPGDWHHLAMVVDADAGLLYLYIDGQLVNAAPTSFAGEIIAPPAEEDEIAWMGHYYGQYRIGAADPLFDYESNYFRGSIDDLRIFDQALSDAQIATVIPEPSAVLTLAVAALLVARGRRRA
ncbi:MAG: Ig-like domain-containing protein, partial [Chloroflexi bacterium]|nr:Ig-like domain-containing protein [Chloroflexota bacterium]